jgi:hypothetical protein
MFFEKLYNGIIKKARGENRKKKNGIYYERHHITPKCIGGTNDKENLVLLTAREHLACHFLLTKIYPTNNKIIYALNAMIMIEGERIDFKMFGYLRERYANAVSQDNKGKYTGWKVINLEGVVKMVSPIQLIDYINDGWEEGTIYSGYKFINRNGVIKQTTIKQVNAYVKEGWKLGTNLKHSLGCKNVNRNGVTKHINSQQVDEYISNGWTLGKHNIGYIFINKEGIVKMVNSTEEINKYIKDGFELGHGYSNKYIGHIIVNRNGILKMILPTHLDEYINDGWELGKNKTCVNKGNDSKLVDNDKVESYLEKGWKLGNGKSESHMGEKNHFYGKHHSSDTKEKISKTRTGQLVGDKNGMYKKSIHDVWVEKHGKAQADIMLKEYSENMVKSTTGEKNGFYGKTHSDKTKQKIANARKKEYVLTSPNGDEYIRFGTYLSIASEFDLHKITLKRYSGAGSIPSPKVPNQSTERHNTTGWKIQAT